MLNLSSSSAEGAEDATFKAEPKKFDENFIRLPSTQLEAHCGEVSSLDGIFMFRTLYQAG